MDCGLYRFEEMPFGAMNVHMMFQCVLEVIFHLVLCLDDGAIYELDDKHVNQLETIPQTCFTNEVRLNAIKNMF